MMGSYGGGGIGADVLAANERKMQYAQGLTAYEPPKSDGFGKIIFYTHQIMHHDRKTAYDPSIFSKQERLFYPRKINLSSQWEELHNHKYNRVLNSDARVIKDMAPHV